MITTGFEFDMKDLRKVEGPLLPEAKNPSEDNLLRAGKIKKFSLKDWTSSAYSQKGLSENIKTVLISPTFIYLGELDTFELARRSFCNEVAYIQCNVKKDDFLHLIHRPIAIEDFEFDLMVALKVFNQLR